MNIHDFLELEHPEKYDFTDIYPKSEYAKKRGVDKYLTYKLSNSEFKKWSDEFCHGRKVRELLIKSDIFKYVGKDPDHDCQLLKGIYKQLWNKEYLPNCSDAMNSVQTIWNIYIGKVGGVEEKLKEVSERQKPTLRFIVDRLCEKENDTIKIPFKLELKYIGNAEKLMKVYHTIGNYMPVPEGVNTWKSNMFNDCFDLFLVYIYNYYNAKEILNRGVYYYIPLKETVLEAIDKWLLSYGSWDTFVETNFLSSFVEKSKYQGVKYGSPKELWKGHFGGAVLPDTPNKCNEYFKNASKWIGKRGKLMVEAMRKRIREMEETI